MLTLLAALILGLMQGVLEWLPISSEGNLTLLMVSVLGIEPPKALSLSTYFHVGSGLAALVYFKSDIVKILSLNSGSARKLFRARGVIGLPIYLFARRINVGGALIGLTGIALIATGATERLTKRFGNRGYENINFGQHLSWHRTGSLHHPRHLSVRRHDLRTTVPRLHR